MEVFLSKLPDKNVADDITNYIDGKSDKHFFSDIYEGKTSLNPDRFIQYSSTVDIVILYTGVWGFWNYIGVYYSIKENLYIYCAMHRIGSSPSTKKFTSENWIEFHTYVRQDLLDMFIWFNNPKNYLL